jgi:hypothetical protein
MVRPSDDGDIEPPIKVLMDRERIVVRPVGHLDRNSLQAVLGLLACAREAGMIAVVDLDQIEPGDLAGSDVLARLAADGSLSSSYRP